jgi:hypothetical protein
LGDSYRSVTRGISANNKTMDRIARTRGWWIRAECSRDALESYPSGWHDPHYWRNSIRIIKYRFIGVHLPLWNLPQFPQHDPSENDHSDDGRPHEANTRVPIDWNMVHYWYPLLTKSFVLILLSIHAEFHPSSLGAPPSPFR